MLALRSSKTLFSRASLPAVRAPAARSFSTGDDTVITEVKNHVATITLNRPKVLNAMTVALGQGFTAAVTELRERCKEEDIRAVGAAFCVPASRADPPLPFPAVCRHWRWTSVFCGWRSAVFDRQAP